MANENKRIDWADEHHLHMLIQSRKYLWRDDALAMTAKWLDLRPGLTAVDVGCGLGHMGYSFWPFFGQGGTYIGVDVSEKLLEDARKAARTWAEDGTALFVRGDAHSLPLDNDSVDCAMGQTILMHLTDPEKAVAEMARVTRPGGLVLSIEPDQLSALLHKSCSSLPEQSIDQRLLAARIHLHCHEGKLRLGRGDNGMGVRLPHLMYQQGLTDIDVRMSETAFVLHPPYDTELMKHRLESLKRWHLDPKQAEYLDKTAKEEFLAGGGESSDFDKYLEITRRIREVMAEQMENGTFYICGSNDVYIAKGRVPQK